MTKDRLSIHVDNGQSDIFEAVTVLRNGGLPSQSGLVGITNKTHSEAASPILPETIFNIRATGDCIARFSSQNSTDGISRLELPVNSSNNPTAGGFIYSTHNSNVHFGILSGDGELVNLSSNINGVAVGNGLILNKLDGTTQTNVAPDGKSALIIYASGISASGTVALREQDAAPSTTSSFGKIYVRPFEVGLQTQSLYFLDDAGNEYNLVGNSLETTQEHLYGNQYGNTFGGWYTPEIRSENSLINKNTFVGFGIDAIGAMENNTVLGYNSFSGVTSSSENTIIGSHSLTQSSSSLGNVILGYNNITLTDGTSTDTETVNKTIIIGNKLFIDDYPEDYTLAIGQDGTPLVTGLLKGAARKFAILSSESEDTRLTLEKGAFDYNLGHVYENSRYLVTFGSQDKTSAIQARSMMSMRFTNSLGVTQTLVDYDPSGTIEVNPTWESPTFKTPTVSISGDLRVLGNVRFNDGTSLDSIANFRHYYGLANSGIIRQLIGTSYYLGLDYDNVPLASELTSPVSSDNSFVAVDVAGGMGKMSLTSLGAYITSGSATFSDNCNAVFTNADNTIQTDKNSNSVFIGCDVATNATGWKHGIFIGTQAGLDSTTANVGLSSDTACTYIGYQAGHSAANTDNAVFIGTNAGKNADASTKSIFIGPNAGENSTNPNSIGIGPHALGGELSDSEGGSRNIEIVAGLDDNQRLLYTSGELSDTINIQNAIAGNTKTPSISIGKATLTPEAVLEVVRDTTDTNYSLGHTDVNIQKWINNTSGVAKVNESGSYIRTEGCDAWFGNHEGFMTEYIYAPSSFGSPTSGLMRVKSYENGFGDDKLLFVTNRDTRIDIHGPGADGGAAYVVTMMVNGENRPIYVSCSGS